MQSKKIILTNFSGAVSSESTCLRPENEKQLTNNFISTPNERLLARGAGLSYNDSCLNNKGSTIDTQRLNHLISFDKNSGIVVCQAATTFKDLLLLDSEFIPPVIPGTLHATLAGGIAHDIHGKNNPAEGSLGYHLCWFELLVDNKILCCSREENVDLFYATIAGLGLTGIITRIALRLKRASHSLSVENQPIYSLEELTEAMTSYGLNYDYQVAWLDLLNPTPRALLSLAQHCETTAAPKKVLEYSIPKLPFALIKKWNMKLFNQAYVKSKKEKELLSLTDFNNPLDKINHWNRLYGPKGLIQFQASFEQDRATEIIQKLTEIIHQYAATPTLAVLKLLKQSGLGLLSFCKPGFTLAIDFIHNSQAREAILAMNRWINDVNGSIYLAKDILLTPEQYQKMYPNHAQFSQILSMYNSTMNSDLSQRLGITQ